MPNPLSLPFLSFLTHSGPALLYERLLPFLARVYRLSKTDTLSNRACAREMGGVYHVTTI